MKPFSWRCPFCEQNATITEANLSLDTHTFNRGSRYGGRAVCTKVISCPNPGCREITISASLHPYGAPPGGGTYEVVRAIHEWQLIPSVRIEVDAFYWTVLAPDIVNPGREEQGSFSV